jgi:hypothetical protein
MWSGPRNISTALLRSWENRPDTWVTDEPFYAHYLRRTGLAHPGAEEVIRAGEPDAERVAAWLAGPIPEGRAVWYQKQMAHHLLPTVPRGWMETAVHCFLIRSPREMLASLLRILPDPRLDDTGLPQQVELFRSLADREGRIPPVIEARDVLQHPRPMLEALCAAVGVPFREEMLSWPPGPRPTDGAWAPHWYDAVYKSTTFEPYRPREVDLPASLTPLLDAAEQLYAELHAHRLRPPARDTHL